MCNFYTMAKNICIISLILISTLFFRVWKTLLQNYTPPWLTHFAQKKTLLSFQHIYQGRSSFPSR